MKKYSRKRERVNLREYPPAPLFRLKMSFRLLETIYHKVFIHIFSFIFHLFLSLNWCYFLVFFKPLFIQDFQFSRFSIFNILNFQVFLSFNILITLDCDYLGIHMVHLALCSDHSFLRKVPRYDRILHGSHKSHILIIHIKDFCT